jgi:hypothetical protein
VPVGRVTVVIAKTGELTASDKAFVVLPPPLSTNLTVKSAVPATKGVPPMTPVDAARLKPGGKLPSDTVQVTGNTAPDTARPAEYGEPVVPFGKTAVVITGVEVTMTICNRCESLAPALSCTSAVNVDVPSLTGLPLMVPPLSSVSPAGSAPRVTDHE